jgi:uncharacterized OsmC-like protein
MQKTINRWWIYIPLFFVIFGWFSVALAYSPVLQVGEALKTAETVEQLKSLALAALATAAAAYLRNLLTKNSKRIESVESVVNNAVPKSEHDKLLERVESLNADVSILVTQKQITAILQEMSETYKSLTAHLEKADDTQNAIKLAVDDTLKIVKTQADENKADAKAFDDMRTTVTTSFTAISTTLATLENNQRIDRLIQLLEKQIECAITDEEKRKTSGDSKPIAAVVVPTPPAPPPVPEAN